MEADWEFEIGPHTPVIEAYWSGFVDLRAHPERASTLSECRELPGLADALVRLNAVTSPVWSSKTDVFTPETIDLDEMDASADDAAHAIACYIDLLPSGDQIWNLPYKAERDCKNLCAKLRPNLLRNCRVDIVIRSALVADNSNLGATVYFTGCGPTLEFAKARLGECLSVFSEVMVPR